MNSANTPHNRQLTHLQNQIRQVETSNRSHAGEIVSNSCTAIDNLLPHRGYHRGTLVQWISAGGSGADYLSLLVAREACRDGGALVVIDSEQAFFPPAAAALGINLDNLIVLRPSDVHNEVLSAELASTNCQSHVPANPTLAMSSDLLWAIDQSLRCPAVAAVWGPLATLDPLWFRRFQLSAEASGCIGLFLQPLAAARLPSWAEVQWLITPHRRQSQSACHGSADAADASSAWQHLRLQLTRCRGTHTGQTIPLSINHITGAVQPLRRSYERITVSSSTNSSANSLPVAAQLAYSKTDCRPA